MDYNCLASVTSVNRDYTIPNDFTNHIDNNPPQAEQLCTPLTNEIQIPEWSNESMMRMIAESLADPILQKFLESDTLPESEQKLTQLFYDYLVHCIMEFINNGTAINDIIVSCMVAFMYTGSGIKGISQDVLATHMSNLKKIIGKINHFDLSHIKRSQLCQYPEFASNMQFCITKLSSISLFCIDAKSVHIDPKKSSPLIDWIECINRFNKEKINKKISSIKLIKQGLTLDLLKVASAFDVKEVVLENCYSEKEYREPTNPHFTIQYLFPDIETLTINNFDRPIVLTSEKFKNFETLNITVAPLLAGNCSENKKLHTVNVNLPLLTTLAKNNYFTRNFCYESDRIKKWSLLRTIAQQVQLPNDIFPLIALNLLKIYGTLFQFRVNKETQNYLSQPISYRRDLGSADK